MNSLAWSVSFHIHYACEIDGAVVLFCQDKRYNRKLLPIHLYNTQCALYYVIQVLAEVIIRCNNIINMDSRAIWE